MMTLEEELSRACKAIGLQIDLKYSVRAGNGININAAARIHNLGAKNGMLIVRDYNDVKGCVDELSKADYGFSVLSDPRPGEPFDLDTLKEMFREWGWSGPMEDIPPDLR